MTDSKKTVLVTGGAGYIGSHCLTRLNDAGRDIVTVDNLSTGHRRAVTAGRLIVGDIGDRRLLDRVFKAEKIDAVIHFAASAYVGESVENPVKYYRNNVVCGLTLLSAMVDHGVKHLVHSSTCSVYGNTDQNVIGEESPLRPISPYACSKMMFERMATDLAASSGLRPVFLRYFNAAGASPDGALGEDHDPETHLIPLAIKTALGQRETLTLFGTDYPTEDGTCVRDYVHILDLADAHVKALDYLDNGGEPGPFNLGYGRGYSVREVIDAVERVCGRKLRIQEGPRRPGDPPRLVAAADRAKSELGWEPEYDSLDGIVDTAYRWHAAHPDGYDD